MYSNSWSLIIVSVRLFTFYMTFWLDGFFFEYECKTRNSKWYEWPRGLINFLPCFGNRRCRSPEPFSSSIHLPLVRNTGGPLVKIWSHVSDNTMSLDTGILMMFCDIMPLNKLPHTDNKLIFVYLSNNRPFVIQIKIIVHCKSIDIIIMIS